MFRPRPHAAIIESAFFKLPDTLLLVFGPDMGLCVISEAWVSVLNTTFDELHACSFTDLLHEEDRVAALEKLAKRG